MPPNDETPDVILIGGTDELYIAEEGRAFRVGDVMPKTLSHAKRVSLQAAGVRFETRHTEPAPMPAAEPAAAPVRAAVAEAVPADDTVDEKPRRTARKEGD